MTSSINRCRLCLNFLRASDVVSISVKDLSGLLENLLRLTLLPEHDLVCVDCCKKMEGFGEFMKMCQESEKVLMEESLDKNKSTEEYAQKSETKVLPNVSRTRIGTKRSFIQLSPRSNKKINSEKTERTRAQSLRHKVIPPLPIMNDPQIDQVPDTQKTPSEPTETSPSTFHCNYCQHKFGTKIALDVHMRQHTQNMSERCVHCSHSFKTPYELKVHTKVHVSSIVGGMKAKFQEVFNESN